MSGRATEEARQVLNAGTSIWINAGYASWPSTAVHHLALDRYPLAVELFPQRFHISKQFTRLACPLPKPGTLLDEQPLPNDATIKLGKMQVAHSELMGFVLHGIATGSRYRRRVAKTVLHARGAPVGCPVNLIACDLLSPAF